MGKNKRKQLINKKRYRKRTDDEGTLYAIILPDEENDFAASIGTLMLKKAAHNKVFIKLKMHLILFAWKWFLEA